jgi:uncharacterized protein
MFVLKMQSPKDGSISYLEYNQHTSRLTDLDDVSVAPNLPKGMEKKDWSTSQLFTAVSPENPAPKSQHVKRLKIQLGLGCNYTCSYCVQSSEIHKASASSTRDVVEFLNNIESWLIPDELQRIEIWGGEPMLYWKKIEALVPTLKEKYPHAKFTMISNGTMFNRERIDKLYDWGFTIAMSHDGPGQHVRGQDPFQNPKIFEQLSYLINKFMPEKRFSFNAVLTPGNTDVNAIIDWFQRYFPGVMVGFEGVVHDYNGDETSSFTLEQLHEFSIQLTKQLIEGSPLRSPSLYNKLKGAVDSILLERPSSVLFQKCGMDKDDSLTVDLQGNVTTCQNVGAKGEHKIGEVSDFKNIALDTSNHWSTREECSSCPVLQLCQGSCMYQQGDGWVNSCNAEFYYNLAFFNAALFVITGKIMLEFYGANIRPILEKDKVK